MMNDFEIILGMLLVAALVQPIARRLDVPLAIAQVVCGLVLAALPFVPAVTFDPELSFALLVPPLLYRAAFTSSLRDTRRQARPIFLLAVALVLVTTVVVGAVAHAVAPQLPWASALVLGAMVSPPDADITTSIARRLGLPAHLVTILEGETLLNDATSFMSYRLTVRAVVFGTFAFAPAAIGFVGLTVVGILVGFSVGLLAVQVRRRMTDSVVVATISLLTPFAAYLFAESLGGSGVLAVVITGFCVSRVLPRTATARTRVRGELMWETVSFAVGGIVFVLIGLQLGHLAPVFWRDEGRSLIWVAIAVSAAVMGTRLIWVFPASYIPRLLGTRRGSPERALSWRTLLVLGWAGLRGGDTLVMALAIPARTATGAPFPGRELIVSVALSVIFATIVVQGLTLRPLIKSLKLPRDVAVESEERQARLAAEHAALARLTQLVRREHLPPDVETYIRAMVKQRTRLDLDDIDHATGHDGQSSADVLRRASQEVRDAARLAVVRLRDDEVIGDEAMRRVMSDLDLDDLRLAEAPAM